MPLEGFGYEHHQNTEFLNHHSLLVLPPKAVLAKLAPILEQSCDNVKWCRRVSSW